MYVSIENGKVCCEIDLPDMIAKATAEFTPDAAGGRKFRKWARPVAGHVEGLGWDGEKLRSISVATSSSVDFPDEYGVDADFKFVDWAFGQAPYDK